jgi:hypothetical protein
VKYLFCKPKIINIPHDDAFARISALHPDPSGKTKIITLPEDSSVDLSIIIPIYNYANLIEKSIQSILNQKTKYSFEVILVDDGSTDGTACYILPNIYSPYNLLGDSGQANILNYAGLP